MHDTPLLAEQAAIGLAFFCPKISPPEAQASPEHTIGPASRPAIAASGATA